MTCDTVWHLRRLLYTYTCCAVPPCNDMTVFTCLSHLPPSRRPIPGLDSADQKLRSEARRKVVNSTVQASL